MEEKPKHHRFRFSVHTLLAVMMLVGLGFAAWYNRVAIGSPLWGPVYFIVDSAPELQIEGWLAFTGCAVGLIAGACWFPRPWALAVAAAAAATWIFYGILGAGIGC